MDHKKANFLFLVIIIAHIGVVAALYLIPGMMDGITGALDLLLGELIIAVPTLVFMGILSIRGKEEIPQLLNFRRIRPLTAFLMVVYAMLLLPLTMFFNLLTMLFTDNVVMESADMILDYPWYMVLLCVGVLGPLCEECVFRGVMFRGMKKSLAVLPAILTSALMFGLMHMNANQAVYAFALGIFMALAAEAADSLWASLIIHMTINLEQTCTMLLVNKLMPGFYSSYSMDTFTDEDIYMALAVYMVAALIATALAICLVIAAANHEGRGAQLKRIFCFRGKKEGFGTGSSSPVTISLVLAVLLCIGYMAFGSALILKILK